MTRFSKEIWYDTAKNKTLEAKIQELEGNSGVEISFARIGSTTYQIPATSGKKFFFNWGNGSGTWTLPTDTDIADATEIAIYKEGTGTLTVTQASGDTINGSASNNITINQGEAVTFFADTTTAAYVRWNTISKFSDVASSPVSAIISGATTSTSNYTLTDATFWVQSNANILLPDTMPFEKLYFISNSGSNNTTITGVTSLVPVVYNNNVSTEDSNGASLVIYPKETVILKRRKNSTVVDVMRTALANISSNIDFAQDVNMIPNRGAVKSLVDANAGSVVAHGARANTVTLGNNSWVALPWSNPKFRSSAEVLDFDTNPTRLVATVAGYYKLDVTVAVQPDTSGKRYFMFRKNSAGSFGSGNIYHEITFDAKNDSTADIYNATVAFELSANDYIEVFFKQDSGTSLQINSNGAMKWGGTSNHMSCVWQKI